ncbi:MAG: response regulator [Deltaproteobacteria bacterium]|nr:response regulator [Deltaproteobacteria bacterium]
MCPDTLLKDKVILVVDDEEDIVESVEEILPTCLVHKATDYDTAHQSLLTYTYDIVILDIMGVDGFTLLRTSVKRGFPTVMFTAHALTPDALKKSIKLGAVFFLPKENLHALPSFLEEVVLGGGKPLWQKFFSMIGGVFDRRLGPDWKERDQFFKAFLEELRWSTQSNVEQGERRDRS